jgi:hypothetical protein
MEAVDGAIRGGEPGRYHLHEIIAEPLPSGHKSRRWGTAIQRPDGAVALDPDPLPNRCLAASPRSVRPDRSVGDPLTAVAQFLTSLGLELDVWRDAVDFLFLAHLHRVELEDVEGRLEQCQVSDDKAAMLATGLPVG